MTRSSPYGEPPRSRRTFSEAPQPKHPGGRDLADRSALAISLMAGLLGLILGTALAVFLKVTGKAPDWVVILCPFLGAAFVTGLTLLVTHKAAGAASAFYNPSGRSTPHKREYSQAESLVARGLYLDAVTAFELAVVDDPTDPTPYLRVARIYRDHLDEMDDAARWFRRALREADVPRGMAMLARKELVELYTHRMGAPEKALPELARMAHELAGTPEGEWAEAELKDIKSRM